MKANYIHKDSTTLVKNELNQIELQYNTLKQQKFNELLKENQELKKQLEEYKRLGFKHLNDKFTKLENQQKEFIEYLEEEMKLWTNALNEEHDYELIQEFAFKCNTYEEILSKYKEIIGDNK